MSDRVRSVRLGGGANCSSVGSVIDVLFASAAISGVVFAAVAAALATEPIEVVGPLPRRPRESGDPPEHGPDSSS